MITQIKGLHHVTAIASGPRENNDFFTQIMGLRRIKKTVNFDNPDVYHLYYGDNIGTPGGVMTYFPFPEKARGRPGTGEVGKTVFSVPEGALAYWQSRMEGLGLEGLATKELFDDTQLLFQGPDGDRLALVEVPGDSRPFRSGSDVPDEAAIRGFHSVALHLRDTVATAELMHLMGYELAGQDGDIQRFSRADSNGAGIVDLHRLPGEEPADQGAGSVHHVAFAVADRKDQLSVRQAISDAGYKVTEVIDRNYFWAIYFKTPEGILFEVATDEPGFVHDEDIAHLGEALKLPAQHEHLRSRLEESLPAITD
ncbi:MAG: ring-cleaving dioxygenase [Alphaproteobacteria bacterium]|nr:ring-cleaving dioxygenase [Alphaproteobacteria bacterium]